jgi:hypothetical protein
VGYLRDCRLSVRTSFSRLDTDHSEDSLADRIVFWNKPWTFCVQESVARFHLKSKGHDPSIPVCPSRNQCHAETIWDKALSDRMGRRKTKRRERMKKEIYICHLLTPFFIIGLMGKALMLIVSDCLQRTDGEK